MYPLISTVCKSESFSKQFLFVLEEYWHANRGMWIGSLSHIIAHIWVHLCSEGNTVNAQFIPSFPVEHDMGE